MNYIVAVYGTLKNGCKNHYVMEYAQGIYLGKAESLSNYKMWCDNGIFPYARLCEPDQGNKINVELYMVSKEGLKVLDDLEGYPRHYTRITEQFIRNLDGRILNALIYVPKEAGLDRRTPEYPYLTDYKE